MNHKDVISMLNHHGIDGNELSTTLDGEVIHSIVWDLSVITFKESDRWWEAQLVELLPHCNNTALAEKIICLFIELFLPRQDSEWIEKLLSSLDRSQPNWVNELYGKAFEYAKSFDLQRAKESLEDFTVSETKFANLGYSTLELYSQENFTRPLPIKNGRFAKHYLPFIPSLQIETNNDKILERSGYNNMTTLIAPSGSGKTSLMIRRLCKTVGILLTGTATFEQDSQETTDSSVKLLLTTLDSKVKAFGYIRNSIQILLISKLIIILSLIEKSQKDQSILDTFEGSLFSFLAFNQFNESNDNTVTIFNKLFSEFKNESLVDLVIFTRQLIQKVKEKTGCKEFLICVDEANVLEDHCNYKYISSNGIEKGVLSLFVDEILKVNSQGHNIFAGTSFSININNVVQSHLQKTESKINRITLSDFECLDFESFLKFITMHIKEKELEFKEEDFPIRIRQAAQCIEYFVNDNRSTRGLSNYALIVLNK